MLSSIKFKLSNLKTGIHEFMAGNFLGCNYSILNMTVHSILSEYRYRIIQKPISEITENEIYNLIFKSRDIPEATRKVSMTKYILGNLQKEKVDSFCERLGSQLKTQHESLLSLYNIIYNKCLFDKHKAKFNEYLQNKPTKLEIPDPLNDPDFINSLKEFNIDVDTIKNFTKQAPSEKLSNFLIEVSFISGEILYLWHKFIDLIRISPKFVTCFFEFDYLDHIKARWQNHITTAIIKGPDWRGRQKGTFQEGVPFCKQKMSPFYEDRGLNVLNVSQFDNLAAFPHVFEQIFCKNEGYGSYPVSDSDNYK